MDSTYNWWFIWLNNCKNTIPDPSLSDSQQGSPAPVRRAERLQQGQHKSRPKVKCYFGPQARRGRRRRRCPPSPRRDLPPSPPPVRTRPPTQGHQEVDPSPLPSRSPVRDGDPLPQILPDRPTLMNPVRARRSPFGRYMNNPNSEPEANPYRFLQRRLGITAEQFEAELTKEIDDFLLKAAAQRMRERSQAASSSSESSHL